MTNNAESLSKYGENNINPIREVKKPVKREQISNLLR